MSAPRVTVVVTTFNHRRYLGEALASVEVQDFTDRETIVIDDGSTDGTADQFAGRPGIRYLAQPNRGAAAARNRGVAEARGELIAFLDSDDVWSAGKLRAQVEFLDRNPEVEAVSVDLAMWSPATGEERPYDNSPPGDVIVFSDLFFRNRIQSPTAVMVRKTALAAVGGFDPAIRYVDDFDLWLRLSLRRPLGRIPRRLARFRIHDNTTRRHLAEMKATEIQVLLGAWSRATGGAALTARERKHIARRWHELAWERSRTGSPGARKAAVESLRLDPWLWKSWVYWALGFAPGVGRWLFLLRHGRGQTTPWHTT